MHRLESLRWQYDLKIRAFYQQPQPHVHQVNSYARTRALI
jgi:hypothetical protein